MPARRYEEAVRRGAPVTLRVNGQPVRAFAGESVAAALLAAGLPTLRRSAKLDQPRGVFCGMGVCFDCAAIIDGRPNTRACVTPVRDGMTVEVRRAGHD